MHKPEFLLIMEDDLKKRNWHITWGQLCQQPTILLERFQYHGCFIMYVDGDAVIGKALRYYDDLGEQWRPVEPFVKIAVADPESIDFINSTLDNMKRAEPYVDYIKDPNTGYVIEE